MHVDVLLEIEQLLVGALGTLVREEVLEGLLGVTETVESKRVPGQTEVDVVLREGGREGERGGGREERVFYLL